MIKTTLLIKITAPSKCQLALDTMTLRFVAIIQKTGAAGSNNKLLLIASEASEQRGSGGHAL